MFSTRLPLRGHYPFVLQGCIALAALAVGGLAAQQASQPSGIDRSRVNEALRELNVGRSAGQVAVSPDGKRIAWVRGRRESGEIFVAPIGDLGKPERVSAGVEPDQHCLENDIVWEPDSKGLAFFSDCG